MLKAFAWYLYLNKDKKIVLTINGTELDYRKYINTDASVEKEILIFRIPFKIALIVWNEKLQRISLCISWMKRVLLGRRIRQHLTVIR